MPQSDSSRDNAAAKLGELLAPAAVDALLAEAEASGIPIDGPDGLLAQITKAVLERALDVEIADHLGYEHGDPAGNGSGNSRNGHGRKTVLTTAGPVDFEVPRDRNGTFTPAIVPKRKRRLGQVEDMILSLYAHGMSTRDITEHLGEEETAQHSTGTDTWSTHSTRCPHRRSRRRFHRVLDRTNPASWPKSTPRTAEPPTSPHPPTP